MAKNLPQPILRKIIFQAIYKPDLKFFDLLYQSAQKFDSYESWEVNNKLQIFLHDYKKRCTLAIQPNSFLYDWDYGGTKNYKEDIQEAIEILSDSLEIEMFTRIGLKYQFLIPVKMRVEELNNILNLKFLSQDEQLTAIFPSGISDMSYVVVGSDNELKLHIILGPMRKKEISKYLQINQKYNFASDKPEDYASIFTSYPEVSIFLNIDIFREDEDNKIPKSYVLSFLERADVKLKNKTATLRNYIFSTGM